MISAQTTATAAAPTRVAPAATETPSTAQQEGDNSSLAAVWVQPKLSIGAADDPLEKEADAMADKVMRMPMPQPVSFLSSQNMINRKCAHCEEEEKLQRKESSNESVSTAPAIVHETLNAGGKSLDADTRSFMEPRFNYDFSKVKIHDGEVAAKSASSINALAYTSGNNIVFNSGQYNTTSEPGKRLLAHELTHVVQQQQGTIKPLQRKTETAVTVTVDNTPGACSLDQHRKIVPAVAQAQQWLNTVLQKLGNYISDPKSEPAIQAALQYHFHSVTDDTAKKVNKVLGKIKTDMLTRPDLDVLCNTDTDKSCNSAGAYVSGSKFVFCPAFFGTAASAEWQSLAIIHEMAHSLVGITHITDRAYLSNRIYRFLTTNEALTNADSFESFCAEVVKGKSVTSTAPQDTIKDCSKEQKDDMNMAIARVERWNRNAQVMTNDQRAAMLARWQDLQTQHLGGTTANHIAKAKKAYDAIYEKLKSSLTFECESSCDEGVASYYRYFLFFKADTLHLCPIVLALQQTEKAIEMYKIVLVRFANVSVQEATDYAIMAQQLNDRFWPPAPAVLQGY